MAATAELETQEPVASSPPMPQGEGIYEFIDGRWIETPIMSYFAILVTNRLSHYLTDHVNRQTPCPGQVVMEMLFRIPLTRDASRKRCPDVAFVSAERWPLDRPSSPYADAWNVVPDLAVEVVSPSDIAENLLGKVNEYFHAGVRLVWVVYPIQRCIHVFDAWNRIRVLTETDILDGGDVLPRFHQALDGLFGPIEPANGQHA